MARLMPGRGTREMREFSLARAVQRRASPAKRTVLEPYRYRAAEPAARPTDLRSALDDHHGEGPGQHRSPASAASGVSGYWPELRSNDKDAVIREIETHVSRP